MRYNLIIHTDYNGEQKAEIVTRETYNRINRQTTDNQTQTQTQK